MFKKTFALMLLVFILIGCIGCTRPANEPTDTEDENPGGDTEPDDTPQTPPTTRRRTQNRSRPIPKILLNRKP